MGMTQWLLLIKFIIEGIGHLIDYIKSEETRKIFESLKNAKSDEERQEIAKYLAAHLYRPQ